MGFPDADPYATVASALAAGTGFRLPPGGEGALAAAVDRRAAEVACGDVGAYGALVAGPRGVEEVQSLFDLVAVGRTGFFRHLPAFRALHGGVLPGLRGRPGAVTLASVGCSTGEEAWSLAAAALDVLGTGADVAVVGRDLSRPALRAARRGAYRADLVEAVPAEFRRWFRLVEGLLEPVPALRRVVRFERANLVADPAARGGPWDVVCFANVGIYFERDVMERLVAAIADGLRPGGHLFLGHAESLWGLRHPLELVDLGGAFAYRRPSAPVVRPPSGALAPPPRRGAAPETGAVDPALEAREAAAAVAGLLAAGDMAAAEIGVAELLSRWPMAPEVHYLAGQVLHREGRDEEAFQEFGSALYCDAAFGLAHFCRAAMLEQRGEGRRAAGEYTAAGALLGEQPGRFEVFLEDMSAVALAGICRARAAVLTAGAPGSEAQGSLRHGAVAGGASRGGGTPARPA